MKHLVWMVMLVSSGPVALAATPEGAGALPAEAVQALHSKGHAILYSLEPWSDSNAKVPRFHGYQILGQSELTAAQEATAVASFDKAIAGFDGNMALCFDPRHAIRIRSDGHDFDFLLCYACHQLAVFRDDAKLAEIGASGAPQALNALLTSLHVPLSHSLEDLEKGRAAEDALIKAGEKRFLAAMPASLRPFWDADAGLRMGMIPMGKPLETLRAAFASANPDRDAAIRVLLVWNGSGNGRWNGFPGYEDIVRQLLQGYPTDRIVAVAQAPDASEVLLEGAARYFAASGFMRRNPQEAALVPAALRQRLLEHTLRTSDIPGDERTSWAKEAFSH